MAKLDEMNKDIYDEPRSSDDQVAKLLRHARRRAPAPAATRERAFAKLHDHWSARRHRKRVRRAVLGWAMAASTVLAVGISLLAVYGGTPSAHVTVAHLLKTTGNGVQLVGADGFSSLAEATDLAQGQILRTGADSRAALAWNHGGSLRMDAGTEIELVSADLVRLVSGSVYFDSESPDARTDAEPAFSVETPFGLATHVGTQFQTRLHDNMLTLSVREGEVALASGGKRVLLPAGDEYDVKRTGVDARRAIQSWDESWQWTQDIAPAFTAEGNSVQALLNWIARETGYTVRYRDHTTAQFARQVTVHGLDSLSPMNALQSIPYIADLQYELNNGVIEIRMLDMPR